MNVSGLIDFAPREYKQPQTEGLPESEGLPVAEPTALAPRDGLEMPVENLGDLVDQVFGKSNGEIDSLIEEFERLRRKLKTDGENIKREIEEYRALSQQMMELTKAISGSVEKVRASVGR
jgi:hypothetical protein